MIYSFPWNVNYWIWVVWDQSPYIRCCLLWMKLWEWEVLTLISFSASLFFHFRLIHIFILNLSMKLSFGVADRVARRLCFSLTATRRYIFFWDAKTDKSWNLILQRKKKENVERLTDDKPSKRSDGRKKGRMRNWDCKNGWGKNGIESKKNTEEVVKK